MPRRVLHGRVVSDANDKTVTVSVERLFRHPAQQKIVRSNKKYHVHDSANAARKGDRVTIRECAPISRRKRWELVREE